MNFEDLTSQEQGIVMISEDIKEYLNSIENHGDRKWSFYRFGLKKAISICNQRLEDKDYCDSKNCNKLAKITWIGSTDRKLHHSCINHFNKKEAFS